MNRSLKNYVEHCRRWNIPVESSSFEKLKNRILAKLTEYLRPHFAPGAGFDTQFAYLSGRRVDPDSLEELLSESDFSRSHVFQGVLQCTNVSELATALHWLFVALEKSEFDERRALADAIAEAAAISPGVGIRVLKRKDSVLFCPAGASLLDKGAVDDPLDWLHAYPAVAKQFEAALRIYAAGDYGKYRNLLDDLRLALEMLLRDMLGNKKSLENQKQILLPWLQQRGLHQQVVNMYDSLLFGHYAAYQNDAVKHGEKYSNEEVEFMIYLTGTFMRLLLQIAKKKGAE